MCLRAASRRFPRKAGNNDPTDLKRGHIVAKLYSTTALTIVSLAAVLVGAPALAQDAPAGTDAPAAAPASSGSVLSGEAGDIVVTAQKRSQNIQKVGIAITAYSGDQL